MALTAFTLGQAATATAQVTITEVFVDVPAADQVTINGNDFDNGPNLVVTLGDSLVPLVIVPDPTSNQIIAELPDTLTAGDYLLTVRTGGGPNRQDDYDLTIGAAGPIGVVPLGAIILWDQNNACPAGFAGVAAFDGRFLVGGNVANAMGGANQHAHGAGNLTGPSHRHILEPWNNFAPVDDNSGGTQFNARTDVVSGGSVTGTSGVADNLPPFMTILLCRRN
ncbi:MAG: IPT/TIG domain-containing protein [Alphaproteobacteria bacterium]